MPLKNILTIARSWSFTITFIPVTVATLIAAQDGPISAPLYLLTLLAACLLHAGANILNDYFDLKNKIDNPQAPTALYRPHPVFALGLSSKKLLFLSVGFLGTSFFIGVLLAATRTFLLGPAIFFGFFLAVFYTAGPINLKYIALGEPTVFLAFGPLMIEGTYAIQRLGLSTKAFYLSLPLGSITALVLLANNLRDIDFDARHNIRTIGTVLGRKKTLTLYAFLSLLPYALVLFYLISGIVKVPLTLVFLGLPKTLSLIRGFSKAVPVNSDSKTAETAFLFGLLLICGLFLEILIH